MLCAMPWGCGEAAEGDAAPEIRLVTSTHGEGKLTLAVESAEPLMNIWDAKCGNPPLLRKRSAEGWVALQDERPNASSRQAYYLDDTLVENCSLGCDGGASCYDLPLRSEFTLSTLEYVQVGSRTPEASDSPCIDGSPLPVFEARATSAPYEIELRYMLGACPAEELRSQRWEIPAQ